MPLFSFIIPGPPAAKGRPRAFIDPASGRAKVRSPTSTVEWEAYAVYLLRELSRPETGSFPLTGPVRVTIEAWFDRPKAMCWNPATSRKHKGEPMGPALHVKKPDADNIAKIVLDAVVKAGLLRDDVQVVDLVVKKRIVRAKWDGEKREAVPEAPYTRLWIEPVEGV